MKPKFREESDSIGKIKIEKNKYWGAQTQRSLENFKIGNDVMPPEIIYSFALQKKAAAISNIALKKLDMNLGEKIIEVCDEIILGKFNMHFPLSVWQTGSGTQTNMNMNEVIANRSNELLGKKLGTYKPIHPNDHCNMGQSSNDSFPTVINITIVNLSNNKLVPCLKEFSRVLEKKKKEFSEIIKIGRTHYQDATPLSLGNEFGAFESQINHCLVRINNSLEELYYLAQGGTAVGTGLNSSNEFSVGFVKALEKMIGVKFKNSTNYFESLSSHEAILSFSGAINTLVSTCYKISNDVRLLSSGPRCGINEIIIPANEPGSSIMPGKVNPTQCEALAQVCIYLQGIHFSISNACSQGSLQLNTNKTLLAFAVVKSINLINDAINSFVSNCLIGIEANKEKISENLNNSLMLVTALNPKIGYTKAAAIAKLAFEKNITLRDAAKELNYLDFKEFDEIVDPKKMIKSN